MKKTFGRLFVKLHRLLSREDGQDLIEYAFMIALIASAATAGMSSLANGINSALVTVGTTLAAAV